MFSNTEKIGGVLAVLLIAGMGVLVWHGPFHLVNKPVAVSAQGKTIPGAAAGMADFTGGSCGGCHTLSSAGTTGSVGPKLDHIGKIHNFQWLLVQLHTPCAPGHDVPGYPHVACATMQGAVANLSEQQRHDLAAFLSTQK